MAGSDLESGTMSRAGFLAGAGLWFEVIAVGVLIMLAASPADASTRLAAAADASTATAFKPPHEFTARRMSPRPGAVAPGTVVKSSSLWTNRVFANASDRFALVNEGSAQYPARSLDGGRVWRIDGPQFHVDALDAAEAVGYVGVLTPRTFYAYGGSVVDVTTDGGRSWWEASLDGLVVAVVPGPKRDDLVAYAREQLSPALTSQYVSRDGGRIWTYTTDGID